MKVRTISFIFLFFSFGEVTAQEITKSDVELMIRKCQSIGNNSDRLHCYDVLHPNILQFLSSSDLNIESVSESKGDNVAEYFKNFSDLLKFQLEPKDAATNSIEMDPDFSWWIHENKPVSLRRLFVGSALIRENSALKDCWLRVGQFFLWNTAGSFAEWTPNLVDPLSQEVVGIIRMIDLRGVDIDKSKNPGNIVMMRNFELITHIFQRRGWDSTKILDELVFGPYSARVYGESDQLNNRGEFTSLYWVLLNEVKVRSSNIRIGIAYPEDKIDIWDSFLKIASACQ